MYNDIDDDILHMFALGYFYILVIIKMSNLEIYLIYGHLTFFTNRG
jgi:hypothetical protein